MKYLKYLIVVFIVGMFFSSLVSCKKGAEKYLQFEINASGDGYLVVDYKEKKLKSDLIIPSTYEGMPVVGIKKNTFEGCDKLEYVYIPGSMTYIGEAAFKGCKNLSKIEFANGIKSIETYAFEDCTSLKSISFPNSIEYFGYGILSGATGLASISTPYVGEARTSIYDMGTLGHFFGNHNKADCVEVTHNFGDELESNYFIPVLLDEVIIKDSVKIAYGAFSNCSMIKRITIEKAEVIENKAFKGCINLEKVSLPADLNTIKSNVFENCILLKEINVPKSVTTLEKSSFEKALGLEKVTFEQGSNGLVIGEKAFYGCIVLKEIVFGEGVAEIGKYGFSGCLALTKLNLPASLKTIGDYAFMNTPITECDFTKATSLEKIGNFAFAKTGLTKLVLGSNVKILGVGSFALTNIEIADLENTKITTLESSTFSECAKLETAKLPNTLEIIEMGAFNKCTNLKNVNIPQSVKSLSVQSFLGCTNLVYNKTSEGYYYLGGWLMGAESNVSVLTIPNTIVGIASSAFADKSTIKQISFSNSVLYIGDYAFSGCLSLEKVSFGNNLQTVGDGAFANCSSLKEFHLPNTVNYIGKEVLLGNFYMSKMTIPYIPLLNGNGFVGTMFGIEKYSDQYSKLIYLTEITLTKTTDIPDYAFYGLKNLEKVVLPNTVVKIGKYAFSDLDKLTTFEIPTSVIEIMDYAFYNTNSLSRIYLSTSIKKMGTMVFAGCGDLIIDIEYESLPEGWNSIFTTSTNVNYGVKK